MTGFQNWFLLEGGRLDRDGFNDLFRQQLDELLPRVTDSRRRSALAGMRAMDWIGYILTAVRNAGIVGDADREATAHEVAVHLLVQPGKLFAGYDPTASGPMPARFAVAVRNAVRNVLRSRSRRRSRSSDELADAATAPPDLGLARTEEDDLFAAFRTQLRRALGVAAIEYLDLRLRGLTTRQILRRARFARLGRWRVRVLIAGIRAEAEAFARRNDDGFAAVVERLLRRRS
jgi:hypothetical protein